MKSLFAIVKKRLEDLFIQEMHGYFENSAKCFLYKHLITTHDLQYYLRKSLPNSIIRTLSKFRLSAHSLNIETGRYNNIQRQNRICTKCNRMEVEDEFHFVFVCPLYNNLRTKFIKRYYWRNPSMFKLIQLFSVQNKKSLCNLGKFIQKALHMRGT